MVIMISLNDGTQLMHGSERSAHNLSQMHAHLQETHLHVKGKIKSYDQKIKLDEFVTTVPIQGGNTILEAVIPFLSG
jgi:hypothetical protein